MVWKAYINGKWVLSSTNKAQPVKNPANLEQIAEVTRCGDREANEAVQAAAAAAEGWASTAPAERAQYLRKIARNLEAKAEELALLITREIGMPVKYCQALQVDSAPEEARYYADITENYAYEKRRADGYLRMEPYGVAAFLTPWNYPLDQITMKVFPALAAGNTVIVNPSDDAPLSAVYLAELIDEVNLPPGVFNLLTGNSKQLGQTLSRHPGVDIVSFTGSSVVGKQIMANAAANLKKCILELGGKSALLLLDKEHEERALRDALASVFIHSGQTCCAYTRLIIPADRKEAMEQQLVAVAQTYVLGNPLDGNVDIGPVISARAKEKVCRYIELGHREGARSIFGDKKAPGVTEAPHAEGYYVKPVIFTDVRSEMRIAQEEIFGPVLVVLTYKDLEEALRLVNDSRYGLDCAIYGEYNTAVSLAKSVQAGNVHINGAEGSIQLPFGGYKESGLGREGGMQGFEEYLQAKSVFV